MNATVEIVRDTKVKYTLTDGREIFVKLSSLPKHGEVLEIECENSVVMIPNGANGIYVKMD